MIHFEATAALSKPIALKQVERDSSIVTEYLDYIRWLADQNTGHVVTSGQMWELYHETVLLGRYWSEVCEELELPTRDHW